LESRQELGRRFDSMRFKFEVRVEEPAAASTAAISTPAWI